MTHVLTIAARELRERNRIFVAAAAFAVLPFLTSLLPGVAKTMGRPVMIALVGGLLAVAMGLGVSVALGASVVGRELSEKRLSFFFSKPVSSAAIWWGKVIASLVAALVSFAIVLVPALMVGTDVWKQTWTLQPRPLITFVVICAVVLFFVSHAVSTMIRSRSALLAIDVSLLAVALYVLYALATPLMRGAAVELLGWMGLGVATAVLLVLAVVPVWQLERGRTDRVRSHAALSRYLWSGVAIVLVLTAAVVLWTISVQPSDLLPRLSAIEQSPDGRTTVIAGQAKNRLDYHASFVLDENGKATRFSAPPWWSYEFSRNGEVLAWRSFGMSFKKSEGEIMVQRRNGEAESTGLRITSRATFILSDDGSRLALIDGETVSVHDIASNRILVSARAVTSKGSKQVFFLKPDLLRIVDRISQEPTPDGKANVRVVDLDVRTRTTKVIAEVNANARSVGFSPDGRLMFVRGAGHIIDTTNGSIVRTVTKPTNWGPWAQVLSDGTTVVRVKEGVAATDPTIESQRRAPITFRIVDPSGAERTVALPGATGGGIAGQVGPRQLLLSLHRVAAPGNQTGAGRAIAILDVDRGALTKIVEDKVIAGWSWSTDPRVPLMNAERVAAIDAAGKPVMVNVLTGESKPLVRE